MPDEIRINRPQQQPAMQQRPEPAMQPMPQNENNMPQKSSKAPWIILAVVVVLIVILGFLFRDRIMGGKMQAPTEQASGYQAVFLTNGQVYFGKISNPDSDYVTLTDIYYLQVGPQQGSGTTSTGEATQTPQQSISLVKLGNELHGPVDEMHISRQQVLFYEDLKADGQVVKAIEAYKANPSGTTPTK